MSEGKTPHWVGVVDPDTNAGYGFYVEAADAPEALRLAKEQANAPFVVNAIGVHPRGEKHPEWLWHRIPSASK